MGRAGLEASCKSRCSALWDRTGTAPHRTYLACRTLSADNRLAFTDCAGGRLESFPRSLVRSQLRQFSTLAAMPIAHGCGKRIVRSVPSVRLRVGPGAGPFRFSVGAEIVRL